MTDPVPRPLPPELPPPPGARKRRWWRRPRRRDTRRTPDRPCLNCGDPTVGFFCPTCGQKKVDVRVSLRRMLGETLEDEMYMNVLLPRTVAALLFRPGHLTREYVQGRIVRYIQPLRLYLAASVLFFVLLPWLTNLGAIEDQIERESARADSSAADSAAAPAAPAEQESIDIEVAVRDSARVPLLLRPINRRLVHAEDRLNSLPPAEALRVIRTGFMESLPTGIFLMMPIFAGILKVLYLRRKRFYVEHFVFALHVHAFTFFTFVLMLLVPWGPVNAALSIWLVLYVFLAMKRVYAQGYLKTFAKYLLLGWAYSMLLVVGVTVTMMLTAISI